MASAMCQAYPTCFSDYNAKSLFISVSENYYEKLLSAKTTVYLTIHHSASGKLQFSFTINWIKAGSDFAKIREL